MNEPCRRHILGSREENEIRAMFYRHWEKLKNQMEIGLKRIDEWRSQSIEEIKSYADEQIRILKAHYDQQQNIFYRERSQHLEKAKVYYKSGEKDLFKELWDACQLLKYQVVQFENVTHQKSHPRVLIIQEQVEQKADESTMSNSFNFDDPERRLRTEDCSTREINNTEIAKLPPESSSIEIG